MTLALERTLSASVQSDRDEKILLGKILLGKFLLRKILLGKFLPNQSKLSQANSHPLY